MWSRLLHMLMVLAQKNSPLQRLPNPITHENKFGPKSVILVQIQVFWSKFGFGPKLKILVRNKTFGPYSDIWSKFGCAQSKRSKFGCCPCRPPAFPLATPLGGGRHLIWTRFLGRTRIWTKSGPILDQNLVRIWTNIWSKIRYFGPNSDFWIAGPARDKTGHPDPDLVQIRVRSMATPDLEHLKRLGFL